MRKIKMAAINMRFSIYLILIGQYGQLEIDMPSMYRPRRKALDVHGPLLYCTAQAEFEHWIRPFVFPMRYIDICFITPNSRVRHFERTMIDSPDPIARACRSCRGYAKWTWGRPPHRASPGSGGVAKCRKCQNFTPVTDQTPVISDVIELWKISWNMICKG